ncbi:MULTISPECIES: DUF6518 family protein [Streptomyces]|uniref:DUF6518 family protein n=2 Tax=Streptomyces TaxID=1883 RepID=A0ABV9IXB2_9ACTN
MAISASVLVVRLNRWWSVAPVAGLGVGVLTNLAQGWLPGAWNQIANSGAVWCVPAFVAGALTARRPAVAGLCTTLGLVVGYYAYAEFGRDGMGALTAPLLWLVMAVISGPLFGIAGDWWRRGRSEWRRVVGLAALAGVFGMEAALYAWTLHYATQAWACVAMLVLLPLLMGRRHRERGLALLTAVVLSSVAYAVIELPLQHVAG